MKMKVFAACVVVFLFCGIVHADLNDGLIAYYPFNGNANDESGNGNNGTVYGATLTTDRFLNQKSAYHFNGDNTNENRIQVADNRAFNFILSFSVAFWYKPNGAVLGNRGIIGKWREQGGNEINEWTFVTGFSSPGIDFHVTTITQKHASTTTIPINNEWYFVVGIYDGQNIMIYLNGVLEGVTPQSGSLSYGTENLGIGNYSWTESSNNVINGVIDQIRIYNRVITVSEIKQLYQDGINQSPTITSLNATPKTGNPPLTVNFDVVAKDPDGSIASYQWDFDGNGRIDSTTTIRNTEYTYPDLGIFNAKVTILDNKGSKVVSKPIPITVAYGPDLVGKVETYDFSDATNTIHVNFKISNTGKIPTPAFNVKFHLSNNGRTLLPAFKEMTVSEGLGVEASTVLSMDNTFEDSIYGKYVFVIIDPTKQVAEIDETNNGTRIVIQPVATK